VGLGAGAVAQLRARLVVAPAPQGPVPRHEVAALGWAAVIAARHAPAEAGPVLCAAAGAVQPFSASEHDRMLQLATAIGAMGVRCEAVARWLDPPPRGADVSCANGPCSAADLAPDLERWKSVVAEPPGDHGRVLFPPPLPRARGLVAAALAQGALPRELVVRNARLTYEQSPGRTGPRCASPQPAGTPCECEMIVSVACRTPAAETRAEVGACAVTIDDAARRFEVVSRCEALGGNCNAGRVCCPPNRCEPGPDARCVPPP
jgi:hypothetical protein